MTSTNQKPNLCPNCGEIDTWKCKEKRDEKKRKKKDYVLGFVDRLKKEIQALKELQAESEAVEKYMMDVLSKGGGYDDLIKARYRQGAMVDGKWVDEEDDDRVDCGRCDYRFYEHKVGREYITLWCSCGTICKTCLTEKERGQLDEWDEEDWDTELLCCEVQGFECCVCESVMVSVVKNM